MLWLTFSLALTALLSALIAAYFWYRSSIVPVMECELPPASIDDAPSLHILTADANLIGLRRALNESSRLNKLAARWTGLSAALGAAATFAGLLH